MTCKVIRNLCSTQHASVLPHVLNDEFSEQENYEIIIESMFAKLANRQLKPPLTIRSQKRTKNARTKKTKLEI
jgi:hypothetical protein